MLTEKTFLPPSHERHEKLVVGYVSIPSSGHGPDGNEDMTLCAENEGLFGVFDGMGGMEGGMLAALSAQQYFEMHAKSFQHATTFQGAQEIMRRMFVGANAHILDLVDSKVGPFGMGTTASVVKIWENPDGTRKAIIGNVSDSRVYVLRANGKLEQITLDDCVYSRKLPEVAARAMQSRLSNVTRRSEMSAQEAEYFDSRKYIDQPIGTKTFAPHVYAIDFFPGDRIVICSDGVHDNLTDEELRLALCARKCSPQQSAAYVAQKARERAVTVGHLRAKDDDTTIVVIGGEHDVFPDPDITIKVPG